LWDLLLTVASFSKLVVVRAYLLFEYLLPFYIYIIKFQPQVVFAVHLNARSRDAPIYDVELDSAGASQAIRDRFGGYINTSRKNKQQVPSFLSGIYISNVINLSTVVKVEILKILKDRFNEVNKSASRTAFVKSFTSSPTFHVRPLQRGAGSHLSLSFTEAIEQFRSLLSDSALGPAYRRVGMNFVGQLERRFVVLTEAGRQVYQQQNPSGQTASQGASTSGSVPVAATSANAVPVGKPQPKRVALKRNAAGSVDSTPAKR
jgi:hypothetical protein